MDPQQSLANKSLLRNRRSSGWMPMHRGRSPKRSNSPALRSEPAAGAMFMLAVVAGGSIDLRALLYRRRERCLVELRVSHLLGGLAFCLGSPCDRRGAELFTGNNLVVMAWADGRITLPALLRNWAVVYVGNAVGAIVWRFWCSFRTISTRTRKIELAASRSQKQRLPFHSSRPSSEASCATFSSVWRVARHGRPS